MYQRGDKVKYKGKYWWVHSVMDDPVANWVYDIVPDKMYLKYHTEKHKTIFKDNLEAFYKEQDKAIQMELPI